MRLKKKVKITLMWLTKRAGSGGACTLLTEERIHVLCRTKKNKRITSRQQF